MRTFSITLTIWCLFWGFCWSFKDPVNMVTKLVYISLGIWGLCLLVYGVS